MNMSKQGKLNIDPITTNDTRRGVLKLATAVAAFGAAMGVSSMSAEAAADGYLKLDGVKGDRKVGAKLPNAPKTTKSFASPTVQMGKHIDGLPKK